MHTFKKASQLFKKITDAVQQNPKITAIVGMEEDEQAYTIKVRIPKTYEEKGKQ